MTNGEIVMKGGAGTGASLGAWYFSHVAQPEGSGRHHRDRERDGDRNELPTDVHLHASQDFSLEIFRASVSDV